MNAREYELHLARVTTIRAEISLLESAVEGIRELDIIEDPVLAYKVNTAVEGLDEALKWLQEDLKHHEARSAQMLIQDRKTEEATQ